jgi:hypothetical protein
VATANDGSGVYGSLIISLSNQKTNVSGITIKGTGDISVIDIDDGTLQLIAEIFPANASDKTVTWSIASGSELAFISISGVLTALDNGIVTVRATANDGSGVFGTISVSISGQIVPVTGIDIKGAGGITAITASRRILQLNAIILPSNATCRTVTWSLVSGAGLATINSSGILSAIDNGIVTVKASADDGSGIYGLLEIPIFIENSDITSVIVTKNEIKIPLNSNYLSWKAALYNYYGALVLSEVVGSDVFVFDVTSLPTGIYLIVLSKGENIRVAKVIKP